MSVNKNTYQTFIKELQSLWSAEKLLADSMPALIEKATNLGLKKALAVHLAETDQHKVAIEAICRQLGSGHEGDENPVIKNMLDEGQQAMKGLSGKAADAVIITGAIKVEHYEIKSYQSAANTAEELGYQGITQRLRVTMEEERQADTKLNFLEKTFIKKSAVLGAPGLALK